MISFSPITFDALPDLLRHTINAPYRNCNFSAVNLLAYQDKLNTSFAFHGRTLFLRFTIDEQNVYMLSPENGDVTLWREAIECLLTATNGETTLWGIEDDTAEQLFNHDSNNPMLSIAHWEVTPVRDRMDYLYLRNDLVGLRGKALHGKRNHVNKFRALYPQYQYKELTKEWFDSCRELSRKWSQQGTHAEETHSYSINAEQEVIDFVFLHWDQLPTIGGIITVDNRLVAFTYGCAINNNTFDTCVEKADISFEGSFNIINQEFARRLPQQFTFINREEDLGIEGLRKSKLSYSPTELLACNTVKLRSRR